MIELATDLLVLLDNFLMLCSKVVSNLNISYEHLKRPVWLICINIASSIPDPIIKPLYMGTPHETQIDQYFQLKDFFKLIHVLFYVYYRLHMIRHQRVAFAICIYFITMFGLYVVIHFLFVLQRCVFLERECDLADRVFNVANAAAAVIFRSLCETTFNGTVIIMQSIISYVSYYGVFVPMVVEVITALINENNHEVAFLHKKRVAEETLTNSNTTQCVKSKIANFFELHWRKQHGYRDSDLQPFLNTLAPSITEELVVDMNIAALKHSKLFQYMDLAFLRCIALSMEQTYVLPGEILCHKNGNKHKMIYVVSGIIQVYSEDDDDTAVLSLSAGTCLGETSLFFNYVATASIVCKEYAMLQTLTMEKFVKVGSKFPRQIQRLRKMVMNRHTMAKKLKALGRRVEAIYSIEGYTKQMKIMWLNTTLHRLMMNDEDTLSKHMCQNIYLRDELESNAYETVTATATYLDLLAITERTELITDTVFVNYNCCPPILQPNSVLLNVWNFSLCLLALFCCYLIPIYAFVELETPKWFWSLLDISTMLYVFDLFLDLITAAKEENEILDNFRDICSYRCGTLIFWLNLLAAYPLEIHGGIFLHATGDMLNVRLYLNRCLKFAKILWLYTYYVDRFEQCKIILKYSQFIFGISYLVLSLGSIFFLKLCAYRPGECFIDGEVIMDYFWVSVHFVASLMYMLGVRFYKSSIGRFAVMFVFCSMTAGTVMLILLAVIASHEIMSSYFQIHIIKTYYNLKKLADGLGIGQDCRRRIFDYIDIQWDYDSAQKLISSSNVFTEMPSATYKLFKEHSLQDFVRDMPLFKQMNDVIIVELCAIAQVDVLPRMEIISYSGETASVIHYLIDGFVELQCGRKGKQVVGPGESLSVLEAYLNMPLANTYVTLTDCKLLSFSWEAVKKIIVDQISDDYLDLEEGLVQLTEASLTCQMDCETAVGSFKNFGYNLQIDSVEEYEYFVPFDRLQQFSFVRLFLLRVTFLPNGRFVFLWEVARAVFALLSASLFTVSPILCSKDSYWWWVLLFLDLTAWLDIYLRFHYCYYNEKGLLVSHPLKTASHYLNHGFLIDVLGVLPLRFFLKPISAFVNRLNTFLHYTRCLQLYRPYFLLYKRTFLPQAALTVLRYILAIFVAALIISTLVVSMFCDFHTDIPASTDYEKGMTCIVGSWLVYHPRKKPHSIVQIYVISFHFTSLILANTKSVIYPLFPKFIFVVVEHILTVVGYCLYIFFVSRFSALLSKHSDLSRYQRALYLLKMFMRRQKVSVALEGEVLRYYSLQWNKKRGRGVHRVTERLYKTLKMDVIYNVYGDVLETSSVFKEGNPQFYRQLLLECKHVAFFAESMICSVNDITSLVYIVYSGCVRVIAPDGTLLTVLGVGSMFGNLDDYPTVRQTLSFAAKSDVEVLVVPTMSYYRTLKLYPKLHKTFKFLTAMHIDYLKGRLEPTSDDGETEKIGMDKCAAAICDTAKLHYKIWRFTQLFLVCYICNLLQIYMLSVMETHTVLFAFLYLSDLLYFIDAVYVQYHTTFYDETGSRITNPHLIRRKRRKQKLGRLVAVLSTIPLDVPMWFFPASNYWRMRFLVYLRLNRQLRYYNVFTYLHEKQKQLSSNETVLRCVILLGVIGFVTQILHCCYIKVNCLEKNPFFIGTKIDCNVVIDTNADWLDKLQHYLKHFSLISARLLSANQTFQLSLGYYVTVYISIMSIILTVVSTFIFAEICCIVRSSIYWRSVYEAQCCHLLNFMKRRKVSTQLINKTWNYVRFFWKRQCGVTFPELLVNAPVHLKSKVLCGCYSHHINKNVIFKKCHQDFIRQLVLLFRMDTYFTGDYVVFKGDINDTMYFIHKGSVLILSEDTYRKEDIIGKLVVGQCFGILQGLHPSTPHVYYYQAVVNTDILSLNRTTWTYLLDFFPASREVIYKAAESYIGF